MLFNQIPMHLLIHDVTYHPPAGEDDGSMGGGDSLDPIEVKHVRFQPESEAVTTNDNKEIMTNGALYIDAVHSDPFVIPDVDGEIVWNNERLAIVRVKKEYTTKLHHLKVMLV